jgi:hypothetical protein
MGPTTKLWPARILVFCASAALTCIFIIDFCALMFQCGCQSWWAGAAEVCNVHMEDVHHCPWCAIGDLGFAGIVVAIVGVQALLSFSPFRWNWPKRLIVSMVAFPAMGTALGVALGMWKSYWR